jgi:predicted CXXCH cytochrome family protein
MKKSASENTNVLPFVFIFLIVFIVFLSPDLSFSEEGFPDCMRCHKIKASGKVVHPTTCVSCHITAHRKGAKYPHYLSAEVTDLCWKCHKKTIFSRKVGHPPVAQNECLSCHDVHTSDNKALLLAPMPDLCFKCHKDTDFMKKTKHPPVAEGKCTGCHDAHSSDVKNLLLAEMPKECFLCHKKEKYISDKMKKHHSPVATGLCLSCHEPHSSDAQKLLIKAMPDICYMCHDSSDFKNKYEHSPVAAGMCMSCHEPHQGNAAKLLLAGTPELCFNCHDKSEFDRKNIHPPVAAGMCMTCHEAHASPDVALLDHPITDGCLLCHPRIGQSPHAAGGVLQVGHPLKGRKDSRLECCNGELSCASCHNPHSSDYMDLFRYKAEKPFDLCPNCHTMKKFEK